jgi:hypothetical protein
MSEHPAIAGRSGGEIRFAATTRTAKQEGFISRKAPGDP